MVRVRGDASSGCAVDGGLDDGYFELGEITRCAKTSVNGKLGAVPKEVEVEVEASIFQSSWI
jgi:hypothetical protein